MLDARCISILKSKTCCPGCLTVRCGPSAITIYKNCKFYVILRVPERSQHKCGSYYFKLEMFCNCPSAPSIRIVLTSSVTNINQINWSIIKLQVFEAIWAWNHFYRFEQIDHCSQWLPFLHMGWVELLVFLLSTILFVV